jgi:hypothetical protein
MEETVAVKFDEIVFQNDNGIDVWLTVEAPVGQTVVREHPVPANQAYRVAPGTDNCSSALLVARAADHPEDRQTFMVSASPQQAYMTHLTTRYVIGSIHGSIVGRTERGA